MLIYQSLVCFLCYVLKNQQYKMRDFSHIGVVLGSVQLCPFCLHINLPFLVIIWILALRSGKHCFNQQALSMCQLECHWLMKTTNWLVAKQTHTLEHSWFYKLLTFGAYPPATVAAFVLAACFLHSSNCRGISIQVLRGEFERGLTPPPSIFGKFLDFYTSLGFPRFAEKTSVPSTWSRCTDWSICRSGEYLQIRLLEMKMRRFIFVSNAVRPISL